MVILDLREWEGFLTADIELKDDETGERVAPADVVNLIQLANPKTLDDPYRYQVVKDNSIYVLFPLDKPGEVRSWPESSGLIVGGTLTFQDLHTELRSQQVDAKVYWGNIWGNILEVVNGAMEGRVALVSRFPNGFYNAVTWNSLDGRFTVHWDGTMISLVVTGYPPRLGGFA